MSIDTLMLLKLGLPVTAIFAFGFHQLWSLNKDKKRALLEQQTASKEDSGAS